jgi:TetR/AcrR family transcriptional regulator, transcriptional repressor for nem operon
MEGEMTVTSNALSHREKLLRQGMKSFYEHGFNGTTVDAILESSGVPKGSFYHHFKSKSAFGLAVLGRYMEFQLTTMDKWLREDCGSTTAKLSHYVAELGDIFVASGFQRACLAGKFSTELASSSDSFRERLGDAMRGWTDVLTEVMREGQARGDVRRDRSARQLASNVLALIQGAFVLALPMRDLAPLNDAVAALGSLIEPVGGPLVADRVGCDPVSRR